MLYHKVGLCLHKDVKLFLKKRKSCSGFEQLFTNYGIYFSDILFQKFIYKNRPIKNRTSQVLLVSIFYLNLMINNTSVGGSYILKLTNNQNEVKHFNLIKN